MAALLVLLAIPTAIVDLHASRQLSTVPSAYDRFLALVPALTPPGARFLVVDASTDPHRHLLLRTRYVLYPRAVMGQPVAAKAGGRDVPAVRWAYLLRRARDSHAGWVIVWALPDARGGHTVADPWKWALSTLPRGRLPPGAVRLRRGWGLLVRVRR